MENSSLANGELTAHFFRITYSKILSVITKFCGIENLELAEDIVQETFYKAVRNWQHNGIPPNPEAWLFVTAKNEFRNKFRKLKKERNYQNEQTFAPNKILDLEDNIFSEEVIADEQLRMMFICCNENNSIEGQLALILKVLGGFSISEIANDFFISQEAAKKRLTRAKKKIRTAENFRFELSKDYQNKIPTVLKAIYLLFNEGYYPSQKNVVVRQELCFEAMRLAEILIENEKVKKKHNCYALLSLMYLNVSRFEARMNEGDETIEMKYQDRRKWKRQFIDKGLYYLNLTTSQQEVTMFQILATISANHCIAPTFEQTDWVEILSLYNSLLTISDTPIIRLNRCIALSKVEGNSLAIGELIKLKFSTNLDNHYLFHSTIAEFYVEEAELDQAIDHYNRAISLAKNNRDIDFLKKKLAKVVPI